MGQFNSIGVNKQMILPGLNQPRFAHQVLAESGLDSRDNCVDKDHFSNYPWLVTYNYNSRGFRDAEWPNNLTDAIWCFGDSFTVGLGAPWNHTWPQVLAQKTQRRVINISMDGASNAWIARQARQVLAQIQPQHCVIQWSFLHRTETSHYEKIAHTALSADPDSNIPSWQHLCREFAGYSNMVQSIVPNAAPGISRSEAEGWWWNERKSSWPELLPASAPDNLELPRHFYHHWQLQSILNEFNIVLVQQQDYARDGFHYDIQTAEWFVNQILHRVG